MSKRGFEEVSDEMKVNKRIFTDEKGKKVGFAIEPKLPKRSDKKSAGYDFFIQKDVRVLPGEKEIIWTDVKAYMQDDEFLSLHIRSSSAIKRGLKLTNQVGIIDSSYYNNEDNEGNIGVPVENTSGRTIDLKAGERVAQGIFRKYLTTDDDEAEGKRTGGVGSSGK